MSLPPFVKRYLNSSECKADFIDKKNDLINEILIKQACLNRIMIDIPHNNPNVLYKHISHCLHMYNKYKTFDESHLNSTHIIKKNNDDINVQEHYIPF